MMNQKKLKTFTPKLFSLLNKNYSFEILKSDLLSGFIVAIIALPLAMALAIASGSSPDKGIITAIIAGFLISFLGGSRVQIGGPTGAFVIVVFNIIAQHGYDGLIMATFLAGIILIIAGYAKFGQMIKFIPYSVVTGFTAGIAVIIASSQIKDFLGLSIEEIPGNFIDQWHFYFSSWQNFDSFTALIGILSLSTILILRKITPQLPSYLIVILIFSLITFSLELPIETIGLRFPELISGNLDFFSFNLPTFNLSKFLDIIPSAFIIAFLAGIEALLSAVVADGMTGFRHRPNQELIAQGVANIASATAGGLPATGAIARTAANVKAGGQTPMAGIFHAFFLLIFVLFFMNWVAFIPLTILSAILFMVAWSMSEVHSFIHILRLSTSDRIVMLLTFTLTIFIDLAFAIGAGVTIASILFVAHISKTVEIYNQKITTVKKDEEDLEDEQQRILLPTNVEVFQMNGPIFFGVANQLLDILENIGDKPKILILRMKFVSYLDISGKVVFQNIVKKCLDNDIKIIITAIQKQPAFILHYAKIQEKKNVFFKSNYKLGIQLAKKILKNP